MKDLTLTVNGVRLKVRNLDDDFAEYVERVLEESGVLFNRDNPPEKLFNACLHLAANAYAYEKEITEIIQD